MLDRRIGGARVWVHVVLVVVLVVAAMSLLAEARVELSLAAHWGPGGIEHELLNRYIHEYNAQHADVHVSYGVSSGLATGVDEQLLLKASVGIAPDIIHVSSRSLLQYGIRLGLLVPPPPDVEQIIRAAFMPGALTLNTVDGVLFGPPTENQMHAMTLNGTVFDEAGMAMEPPRSWEELADFGRKIRRMSADGRQEVAGIELLHDRTILSMAWSNGAELLNADRTAFTLTGEAWTRTIRFLSDLVAEGVAVISNDLFDEERAGMRLGSAPWMRSNYLAVSGEASYARLVTAPIPAGHTGVPASEQYGYVLAVTTSSQHPDEAWAFINWLTTAPTDRGTTRMGDIMAALGSIPSTYLDLANQSSRYEPYLFGFSDILSHQYTRTINHVPAVGLDVRNTIAAQVLPAIRGEISVQRALMEAERILQGSLDTLIDTE